MSHKAKPAEPRVPTAEDVIAAAVYWVLWKGPWPAEKALPHQFQEYVTFAGDARARFAECFPKMMPEVKTKKRKVKP